MQRCQTKIIVKTQKSNYIVSLISSVNPYALRLFAKETCGLLIFKTRNRKEESTRKKFF